jgi:RsmE family RNA methyltransferase
VNLILLEPEDFDGADEVCLGGRRGRHIREVHRAHVGDTLKVGALGGRIGTGIVRAIEGDEVRLKVALTEAPPPPSPVTLLLALPRPKCLRRVLQCVVTMGVKRMALFGAYRVEKSYWQTPWLAEAELGEQAALGLEQGRDTMPPVISLHPLFKPFMEDVVDGLAGDGRRLVAHPGTGSVCPCAVEGPVALMIGPEGGFTEYELGLIARKGFEAVTLGPRVLRTEQAVPAFLGRLWSDVPR